MSHIYDKPITLATLTKQYAQATDGLMVVDQDQKIQFWNSAAEELLGFRNKNVLGKLCFEVICLQDHDDPKICCLECEPMQCARRGQ